MAFFDSIIAAAGEKFNVTDDQSKALLAALLGLMADAKNGGFSELASRLRPADSSGAVPASTNSGENANVSKDQIEAILGAETIAALADRAGLDYATTVAAMTFLLPATIARLKSNGAAADEQKLRAAIGELSGDAGESAHNAEIAANKPATEAFDRIGNATENTGGNERDATGGNPLNDSAPIGDRFSGAPVAVSHNAAADNPNDNVFNDDSPLKWIVPLIITALLIALGYSVCGGNPAEHARVFADSDSIKVFII